MSGKAKDFLAAFKAGKVSRRELMTGATGLGVSAATANFMLNAAATGAMAAHFGGTFSGKTLHLLCAVAGLP